MEVDTVYTTYSTPANCRDGPRYERGITDCCCCIIYIALVIAALVLAALFRGHTVVGYERPFDFDHMPCRQPYGLLYIDGADSTRTVCVNNCPAVAGQVLACRANSKFHGCPTSPAGLILDKGHHICSQRGIDFSRFTPVISMKAATDAVTVGHREILAAAGLTAALALILVITTFIFPELMTCLYLIMFELLFAAISAGFFYRYFKGRLPFVDAAVPASTYQSNLITLVIAVAFAVAFIISACVMLNKLRSLQFIVTVLKIARKCLWENCYMLIVSFVLSAISVTVLAAALLLFYNSLSTGQINPLKHGPYDQFEYDGSRWWWAMIIGLLYLWTHGLITAISDFLFEGFAIYWYFNERVFGYNYSRCSNFSNSVKLLFWHFGTCCMGGVLAYLPETLPSMFSHFEYESPRFYSMCCCCHKYLLRYLSKYCYIQTILQSYPFCAANEQLFYLRRRVKQQVPQLYMRGNFYETAAKTFLVLAAMVACYVLLITNQPEYYHNVFNLIAPLLVSTRLTQVTAFIAGEIATHFMNCTGLIGDTLVFMYCVDLEIERYRYGSTEAYSCPVGLRPIIKESKLIAVV